MRFILKGLASLFALSALAQTHPPSLPRSEVPAEAARAVTVATQTVENQLHSQLSGQTDGYFLVDVQVETHGRYHIYAEQLQFWTDADAWLDGQSWNVEIVERPPSTRFVDPISHTLKEGYEGQLIFRLKLSLPHTVAHPMPLDHGVPLVTRFQACSEKVCLLPVVLQTALVPANVAQAAPERRFLQSSIERFRKNLGESGSVSLLSLGIILLAGILTSFTPCVYPLYPVTLGIFAHWSHTSGANPFALALSYCAGLTLSYASVGILSSLTGSVFGSLTQTAPFLIGVGLLILTSAVFFSGYFTFPMPAGIMNFFTRAESPSMKPASSAALASKAALMGVGLGVVASPCVGPVLVAILAWLGTSHASVIKGFSLLALFGAGMSLPFLILGHVILRLGKRPSLGRYTPLVKQAGTVVMAGASLFFLVPGFQLLRNSSPAAVEAKYAVKSIAELTPGKWAVVDFRADWCAACLELERETFRNPAVSKRFETGEWEFARVDMTDTDAEGVKKATQDFNIVSLPTVLVLGPSGKPCASASLYGFEGPKEFLVRLESARKSCGGT